jgi:hypothetical protein
VSEAEEVLRFHLKKNEVMKSPVAMRYRSFSGGNVFLVGSFHLFTLYRNDIVIPDMYMRADTIRRIS